MHRSVLPLSGQGKQGPINQSTQTIGQMLYLDTNMASSKESTRNRLNGTETLNSILRGVNMQDKSFREICINCESLPELVEPVMCSKQQHSFKTFCEFERKEFDCFMNRLRLGAHNGKETNREKHAGKKLSKEVGFYHYSIPTVTPLGHFVLDKKNLRLSDKMVSEIVKLRTCDKGTIDLQIRSIFNTYGSHVYVGNRYFGELQMVECTLESENMMPRSKAERMVQRMLFTKGNCVESGSVTYKESNHFYVTESEKNILPWKEVVIDRDKDLVGVWEIAQNHPEINNSKHLLDTMKSRWEYMRNVDAFTNSAATPIKSIGSPSSTNEQGRGDSHVDSLTYSIVSESSTSILRSPDASHSQGVQSINTDQTIDRTVEKCPLILKLGLADYYPSKISIQDVIQIDRIDKGKLPWSVLEDLVMLNRSRTTAQYQNFPENSMSYEEQQFDKLRSEISKVTGHNPLDIFMAIYACCDLNLKQILMQKMFQCKLALPIFFPDLETKKLVSNLWAIKAVSLSWLNAHGDAVEKTAIDCPRTTVSCVRLGRPSMSKSIFMNNVINEDLKNVFVNEDMTNGEKMKQVSEGLVEGSFVLPCKQNSDWIVEPTLFLNLRGDGRAFTKQLQILSQISSVMLLIVNISELITSSTVNIIRKLESCAKIVLVLTNEEQLPLTEHENVLKEFKRVIAMNMKKFIKLNTFTKDGRKNKAQLRTEARKQIGKLIKISEVRPSFDGFIDLYQTTNQRFYMQWLKLHYDEVSRQTLPALQQKYEELLGNMANKDRDTQEERMEDINMRSLEVEHLFREMGQIHELPKCSVEQKDHLPFVASQSLLDGNPLEIINGDTLHVPQAWLNAVFGQLQKKLGDKEIFCLSVVGLQSSGKSTLLNTMFGLQFPVSAGQCTKGICMQLLKVHELSKLPFRYVAVLDSEGLQSQDLLLDNNEHHTKLAKFVIGLSNLTLVNVKGEGISEIKGVLDKAYAFLKKIVEKEGFPEYRSSVIIHQNASSLNPRDQQIHTASIPHYLPASNNVFGMHTKGGMVILDAQKHTYYFPDLWQGTPPEAHVSSSYHDTVKELKKFVLYDIAEKIKRPYTISTFRNSIEMMWQYILDDK